MNAILSSDLVENAARIKSCVTIPGFSIATALWSAGADEVKAFDKDMQERTKSAAASLRQEIVCTSDMSNMQERAMILISCAKRVPSNIHKYPLIESTVELLQKGNNGFCA